MAAKRCLLSLHLILLLLLLSHSLPTSYSYDDGVPSSIPGRGLVGHHRKQLIMTAEHGGNRLHDLKLRVYIKKGGRAGGTGGGRGMLRPRYSGAAGRNSARRNSGPAVKVSPFHASAFVLCLVVLGRFML